MRPFTIIVEFVIRAEVMPTFLDLMLANARTSLEREEGCYRFDVLTSEDSSNRVLLYEIYRDDAAFQAHSTSSHYNEFAAATHDMVISKSVTVCRTLNPTSQDAAS